MNIETILEKIKKGTYAHAEWQNVQVINGVEYVKISEGVVRVLTSALTNKSGVKYARFFLTHNRLLKTKCLYFADGVKISKEEYENAVNVDKTKTIDVCFAKHLTDILALGNKGIK